MDFGDLHHYGGVGVKINLVVLNVEYYFLGMRVFGQHDGDGTVEKIVHGGEILNGYDGRFQSRENVYVRMGCDHHHDGGSEILDEGDHDFLNVEHNDVSFGGGDGVMEKVNDLGFGAFFDGGEGMVKESVTNYGDHLHGSDYDCNGDEGLVRENGFSVYSFLHPWQSHLLNDHWTELVAFCVPYAHVLISLNGF